VRTPPRRDGFAAALAVCLLAALGGLAAASFYTVVEARRSAHRSVRQEQAATAADLGLFATLDRWSVKRRDSLPIGSTDSGSAYVTRLTNRLYWVTAPGEAAAGTSVEAARIHNLLVEILQPSVPTRAAITSAGAVLAGPDAIIDGSDSHPPGWTDCPPADTTTTPAVLVSGDSATYETLGRVATAALAARADITLPTGAIVSPRPDLASNCGPSESETQLQSWGEPARTGRSPLCERFFPVVHAVGALGVTSGRGQGVLVVNGRLRIDGPFVFYGVVIAAGGIEVRGSDVTVYGAVLSADRRGVVWNAAGEVRRSTCAVARVSDEAARPYPVPRRAWAELL
jgi:hypothetical protein